MIISQTFNANEACPQPRHLPPHVLRRPNREHSSLKKLGWFLFGHSPDYAYFFDFEVSLWFPARRVPRSKINVDVIRVFYWFGEYYSATLLTQAVVMIVVQMTMLKVALDNRPSPGGLNGIEHAPFSHGSDSGPSRPYEFWQWKNTKP